MGRRGLIALGVLLLAGAVWWALDSESPPPSQPEHAPGSVEEGPRPALEPASADGRPVAEEPTIEVRGIVLDPSGEPAAGIRVEASPTPEVSPRIEDFLREQPALLVSAPVLGAAVSDAEGRFRIALRRRGHPDQSVITARGGPKHSFAGTGIALPPSPGAEVVLRLGARTVLRGQVVDGAGRGIAARLRAYEELGSTYSRRDVGSWNVRSVATAEDGTFTLSPPAGFILVRAWVPGRAYIGPLRVKTPREEPLRITLGSPGGGRFEGTVLDSSEQPIANAKVAVRHRTADAVRVARELVTKSGSDGAFAFDDLPAGRIERVLVGADGYAERDLSNMLIDIEPAGVASLRVRLLREGTIAGHVRDPSGKPLAGVTVYVHPRKPTRTDASGAYRIRGLAPGDYTVRADKDGYYEARPDGSAIRRAGWFGRGGRSTGSVQIETEGSSATHDVVLTPGRSLEGRVTDTDGNPVAGAEVGGGSSNIIRAPTGARRKYGLRTYTDLDGTFRLGAVTPQRAFEVEARKGMALSERAKVEIKPGTEPVRIDLVLRRGARIRGKVIDATGGPVPRGIVNLRPGGVVVADMEGQFEAGPLQPGEWKLSLVGAFQSESVTRELDWGDEVEDVVLRVPRLHKVTGLLVDESGAPLPHTRVRVGTGRYQETDAEGRFEARGLGEGTATLRVAGSYETHTVDVPGTDLRVVHRVPRWMRVEGTVLAPDGRPVASGRVSARYRADERRSRSARGGAIWDGRFHLEVPAHVEQVQLSVSQALDIQGRTIEAQRYRSRWLAAASAPYEIRLKQPLSIQGRLENERGEPIPSVRLRLASQPRSGLHQRGETTSEDDGTFRFDGLSEGAYEIRITTPPGYQRKSPVPVKAGEADVRVVLTQGATIRGRVVRPDGTAAANVEVSAMPKRHGQGGVWGRSKTQEDGRFVIPGLDPTDTYRVRTEFLRGGRGGVGGAQLRSYSAWVRPGAKNVVIQMVEGVFVVGVLRGPDGAGIGGASLVLWPLEHGQEVDHEGHSMGRTKGDGTFRLGPVPPGTWRLGLHGVPPSLRAPENLEVTAPAEDVEVRLLDAGTVRGTIEGGVTQRYSLLWIPDATRGYKGSSWGKIAEDGSFEIPNMPPGPGTVHLWRRGEPLYAVVEGVTAGDEPLTIRLVKGLSITGTIPADAVDANANLFNLPYVRILSKKYGFSRVEYVKKDGTFVVPGLPEGRYTLSLVMPGAEKAGPPVEAETGATGVKLKTR